MSVVISWPHMRLRYQCKSFASLWFMTRVSEDSFPKKHQMCGTWIAPEGPSTPKSEHGAAPMASWRSWAFSPLPSEELGKRENAYIMETGALGSRCLFREHIFSRTHSKDSFALAGNRTRASRVAGENSTTEPPMHAGATSGVSSQDKRITPLNVISKNTYF